MLRIGELSCNVPLTHHRDFVSDDERDVNVTKDVIIFLAQTREESVIGEAVVLKCRQLIFD